MATEKREISVVIPVYNEEKNIFPLYEKLNEILGGLKTSYEIIFVDDGSKDNGARFLQEIKSKDSNVKILKMKKNYGQTAALDAGFKASSGKIVISMDADLQNDPQDIPRLIEELSNCDVVCGFRKIRYDPLSKKISSQIAKLVRHFILRDKIIDIGCTLRAYRRSALEKIKLYHGLHRFLPILIEWEGFRIKQIEVRHHPRLAGKSKYNLRRRLFKPFIDLWSVFWMKKNVLRYEVEEI